MKISTIKVALFFIVLIFGAIFGSNLVHKVDDTEWQAVQYLNGEIEIKESAGIYFAFFPKITEYDRNMAFEFTKDKSKGRPVDESTGVTFNDGGTAQIDVTLRVALPSDVKNKREFHRQFNGNTENIRSAIWSHLSSVIKSTGPVMSSSENQVSRKSEFQSLIQDQMNAGIYEMRRVERNSEQVDDKGNAIKIFATDIVKDTAGHPVVTQVSPLANLGIKVTQFSITATDYDEQTRKQFSLKKESFLQAEASKAQREAEIQSRLMVIEKGLRQGAEMAAASNLEKTKETINAQKEKEVAETNAAKLLAVSEMTKKTAEVEANQKLEVAKLERMAAQETAQKVIELAKAEKERISLGGALTEEKRVLAEISAKRDIEVAIALAKVSVPSTVINSGSGANAGDSVNTNLMNMTLLKSMNIIK